MDANYLLMLFGSSFGGVVGLSIVIGCSIEFYHRRYRRDENELTDPQNNV
jgi:hypothetical protein